MSTPSTCPPLLRAPLSDDEANEGANVLKAIADPTRLKLLNQLALHGETCVCDFTVDLSQPTVSHHLKILHEAGLVEREKRGTWVYYTLNTEAVEQVREALTMPRTLPRVPAGSVEAERSAVAMRTA